MIGKSIHRLIQKTMLIMVFFSLHALPMTAQEKECLTDIHYQKQLKENPKLEKIHDFESWMKQRVLQLSQQTHRVYAEHDEPYIIPIVVHIIHNGENYGVGSNIPDEQVFNQIVTLNQDFRRLNTDASNTLNVFQPVAADSKIEFRLAQRSPDGLESNGIVRVQGYKSVYSDNDNVGFKSLSYWPAEDYLNLWVLPMSGGLLGYAQFPISDLAGLEGSPNNRLTDGVVVNYLYFGTGFNADSFSTGRTATHEIGHFFGLRHIWGDGGCGADDFCNDTPLASSASRGCPLGKTTCNSLDMVQNYMDYSDDVCMNLFTNDQKTRMHIVLENSPRRKSLTTSLGAIPPVLYNFDIGIRSIIEPTAGICDREVRPQVEVRNFGFNAVQDFELRLYLENQWIETLAPNASLPAFESRMMEFQSLTLPSEGSYDFRFELELLGAVDENPENNIVSLDVFLPTILTIPVVQDFNSELNNWQIQNPDSDITWQLLSHQGNTFLGIDNYNYTNGFGEFDYLISPIIDLQNARSSNLEFKVAHARYPGGSQDGLLVVVSTDCGSSFNLFNPLYRKVGSALATANVSSNPFVPNSSLEWRTERLDLNEYIGQEIRLAFIAQSDNGNNLYLDDILINGKAIYNYDLAISDKNLNDPLICNQDPLQVEIINVGRESVNSFRYSLEVNNQTILNSELVPLSQPLASEERFVLNLPYTLSLNEIANVNISISAPDMRVEEDPSDNTLQFQQAQNGQFDRLPLRQNFTKDNVSPWKIINPSQLVSDQIITTLSNKFWAIYNYQNVNVGERTWLLTPQLEVGTLSQLSLGFDISYASNRNNQDTLLILASTNCGAFNEIAFLAYGNSIAVKDTLGRWEPTGPADWRRLLIDLSNWAGSEQVQFAIVVANGGGNNMYIDNVELYTSSNPILQERINYLTVFPNPSEDGRFNIVFNLPERDAIRMQILNITGQIVYDIAQDDILNQDFPADLSNQPNGLYILRAFGKDWNLSRKILIKR